MKFKSSNLINQAHVKQKPKSNRRQTEMKKRKRDSTTYGVRVCVCEMISTYEIDRNFI